MYSRCFGCTLSWEPGQLLCTQAARAPPTPWVTSLCARKDPPPLSSQLTFDLPTPWRISPEVPCGNRKTKTDSSVLAQSLWGAVGRCGALMALQCSLGLAPAAHHPCIHRGNKIAGRVPPAVLAAEENTFHVFMQ